MSKDQRFSDEYYASLLRNVEKCDEVSRTWLKRFAGDAIRLRIDRGQYAQRHRRGLALPQAVELLGQVMYLAAMNVDPDLFEAAVVRSRLQKRANYLSVFEQVRDAIDSMKAKELFQLVAKLRRGNALDGILRSATPGRPSRNRCLTTTEIIRHVDPRAPFAPPRYVPVEEDDDELAND